MKIIKILVTVFGVLVALMGTVWFLQGIGILPGSMMSGQSQWAVNGGITIVIGMVLIAAANWQRLSGKK